MVFSKLGSTSIGIKTKEGVVLVTERRIQSKLMEAKMDAEKLREIDTHIGCASSGIIADARCVSVNGNLFSKLELLLVCLSRMLFLAPDS